MDVTPGWWLVLAVAAAQLLAEVVRRAMDGAAADAQRFGAAAAELRRRADTSGSTTRGAELAGHAHRLRGLRWRARRRRAAGWLLLTAVWAGSQTACWRWDVNARWTEARHWDEDVLVGIAVGGPAVALLALWATARIAGQPAALDRSVAFVVYVAAGALLVAGAAGADGAAEGTTASAVVIAASPVVRRVVATVPRRAGPVPLSAEAAALVDTIDPPARLPHGAPPATPFPAASVRRSDTLPDIPLGSLAHSFRMPPPAPAPTPAKPLGTPESSWSRQGFGPAPPAHGYPMIDLLPWAGLRRGGPPPGAPPHICRAHAEGSAEEFLFKQFGVERAAGPPAGGERQRNPVRALAPYRELLSRVGTLPTPRRRAADRVLLWPRAVVGDGERAVGVLYPPLAAPFLLREGGAQTGDHLLAEEPDFVGCQVPSSRQRAELLLDVVSAHALLHDLGLAHGDTNWKNFVYGVEEGRGRGRLIDIDSVTSLDDPRPLLMHQPDWGDDPRMPPLVRDVHRVALLVARLAGPVPDWDRQQPPAEGEFWFTPALRQLTRGALERPEEATAADFTEALTAALRGRG
ncbi:hypothetical protein [Streptomyces flavofungini]|uniref:hypothetical protein n=1 Tax=Streptomyces flavofungini TaxID=68200 RepID=UPI0025B05936|nr:hypothetical protein [Streptomyces flavofungini]WJV50565.1 hypothetical protein QUY26_36740 [Streptomyces flavofungini]